MSKRANGEGSIYRYRNGYAAHVWVTTPTGERKRKSVYGKTREEVHAKWMQLHQAAAQGPVPSSTPTLGAYLEYWLKEVVREPDYAPVTVVTYGQFVRHYLQPYLGKKRIDKLTAKDLRAWVNKLRKTCQCCAQGKDASRTPGKRRCCASGQCCRAFTSESNIFEARKVLRAALSTAVREELISRNVAQLLKLSKPQAEKEDPWTLEEVRCFLESARADDDPLYAVYVLILVLGLRKGEALGVTWPDIDLDAGTLKPEWQLQRVRRQLLHKKKTKTPGSRKGLPLPDICLAALKLRAEQQLRQREAATRWRKSALVFTMEDGRPIDPRSFTRWFDERCSRAGVRRIEVHTTRRTCGTLLAALDVHPRVAMRILRHSQIKLTMDIYTEVHDPTTEEALRRLAGSIHKKADPPKES